jgi:adenylyl- and sulfurtransferase ThiI
MSYKFSHSALTKELLTKKLINNIQETLKKMSPPRQRSPPPSKKRQTSTQKVTKEQEALLKKIEGIQTKRELLREEYENLQRLLKIAKKKKSI